VKFTKAAKDLPAQLALLQSKGLAVTDRPGALTYLENLGYYRLSGYTFPFRKSPGRTEFKPGTSLEQIIRIYDFDRELRLLAADAIERIEIGIRSRIVNATCLQHTSPHWFTDPTLFHSQFNHASFLRKLEKSLGIEYDRTTRTRILPTSHPETFIEHYYQKYGDPYLPPFWMVAEILTIGSLSHLYKGIGDATLKKEIAAPFGVPAKILASWLHSVAHLRNICAHHGRLWNRVFSISPKAAQKHRGLLVSPSRFEGHAVVLVDLLDVCSPGHSWRSKFQTLLAAYPEVDHQVMGFRPGWDQNQFWHQPTV